MKKIIIIGGGFAGIAAAKFLAKKDKSKLSEITLIDRNNYSTFNPSLYEVATSEEPRKNVAIPLKDILPKRVKYITSGVKEINPQKQVLWLDSKAQLNYDYLIIAVGSQAAYYNIPGLRKYGLPLKSIKDALLIRETIKRQFHLKQDIKEKLRIVVGGGGFTGTELAAELIEYRKRLTRHHKIKDDEIEISILQGSNRVLSELDSKVSDIATKRLKAGGVVFCFGGHISEVDNKVIRTDNGNTYEYDVLIWTGGVRITELISKSGFTTAHNGSVIVNKFLQAQGFENVFVAGDAAGFLDPKSQKPAVQVAQVAEDEGVIAGRNVFALLQNKPLEVYRYHHTGYFIPLCGKYAVAALHGIVMSGFDVWFLQQFVFLRYFLKILPLYKAFKRFNNFEQALIN